MKKAVSSATRYNNEMWIQCRINTKKRFVADAQGIIQLLSHLLISLLINSIYFDSQTAFKCKVIVAHKQMGNR